jgi:hypothetical protein
VFLLLELHRCKLHGVWRFTPQGTALFDAEKTRRCVFLLTLELRSKFSDRLFDRRSFD